MINKIKIKLYLATIPIIFGLEGQPVSAVEKITKDPQPTSSQTFFSVQPSKAFPPDSEKLTPEVSLVGLLKKLQQFNHQPLPSIEKDENYPAEWVKALKEDIDIRSVEMETLIQKIENLTAELEEAKKQNSSTETSLRTQQQQDLKLLILLQEIQKLESNLHFRMSELSSYNGIANFFGDSVVGKIAAAPTLFGASLFMPLFISKSSSEESKFVRQDQSGNLFLGNKTAGSNPVDDLISTLLVGGTFALNQGFTTSPYLYASLIAGSYYQGGKATNQYVRQVVNGLWGKSMSSQQIEMLAGAAALLYFVMNIPGAEAFPYAAPGTEVQLDSRTNLGVASTTSGNSLFVAMADTTSVNGKFFDSNSLTPTSALYSISQNPVATANIPSTVISNNTYFVGYTLSANGGDIALRAGNATGFFGPEVTIMPNVGAQSGVSLVDLHNGYFAALLNTNPLGSNSDIVGYTFNSTLGVVKGPYPVNSVTTGNQYGPSGGIFSNGKLGVTFTGDQSGTATQYSVVLDPMTGTNIVPDYPLKASQSGVNQGHGMCAELKGGNLGCVYVDGGNLRVAVVDSSGTVICNVQVNDASVSSLNPNTIPFISATGDGNSIAEYTALPVIPGNYRVYYAVVSPSCDLLSKDTIIPKSSNGQTAAGVQALQNNDFVAIFSGSSLTQPGLIGTRIANTGSTATVVPTTGSSPTGSSTTVPTTMPSSASSLQPFFSTWLSGIMSTARTTTLDPSSMMTSSSEMTTFNGNVHSAGGVLINPWGVVYSTFQEIAGWGISSIRWLYPY
ncbi:MAG: hypothetical protein FJX03_04735 [Alphaproteobacteria bacterium]|nr:hypothetical protein [Alphaproteobacteria bacterium]